MVSGAAAVVCVGLARTPRLEAAQAAREWLVVICLGALLAMYGLEGLFGAGSIGA